MTFQDLSESSSELRDSVVNHSIFKAISTVDHVRCFMQGHVFAVWDFMSLLSALRSSLAGSILPWMPGQHSEGLRLLNEIFLEEETDLGIDGKPQSHFEMYLDAMQQCGADPSEITGFLDRLKAGESVHDALVPVNPPAADFVTSTFDVIKRGNPCELAACLTVGREDLIPDLFTSLIRNFSTEQSSVFDTFRYYLDRHIELDSETHGPVARRLIENLCGNDPSNWAAATKTACATLQARLEFWNQLEAQILSLEQVVS